MTISLSPAAAAHIATLKEENKLSAAYGLRLRYDRTRSGAERYALDLDEGPADGDRSWSVSGIAVFCDGKSYLFLGDLTIDYRPADGGFVVQEHAE